MLDHLNPNYVALSAAGSGDNTVVAAQVDDAGNDAAIIVTSLFLVCASAVTVRFESAAGGTALTGVMSFGANDGFALPYNPQGWFKTTKGQLLNLELSAAVQVSGALSYVKG